MRTSTGTRVRHVAALVALLVIVCLPAGAQRLDSLDTKRFQLVYPGGLFGFLIPHVAETTEAALRFHEQLYGYTSREKIVVLLEDFSDFGHGGANTVPTNFINFGVAPFNYVYETIPAVDRFYWMANHEVAHIATMDQATDRDLAARGFFGGKVEPIAEAPLSILYNYFTNPRWNAPRWYHEGIAVFLETWMAGGLGRGINGYDEMVFRAMTRDDALFYDVVGLESEGTTIDFQVGVNSYLYGSRFMSYLAKVHGPESVVEWTGRRPGSKAYFAKQFRHVYGVPLAEAWSKWIEWEKSWQQDNLARIRQNPISAFRDVSDTALGSVSRSYIDPKDGRLLTAVRYPGHSAHLAAIDLDTGAIERLLDLDGAAIFYVTSLAFDELNRRLFYTTDNYGWRDLNMLDLESGRHWELQKDFRAGDMVYRQRDNTLWVVRHYNGLSTLAQIEYPWDEWKQVHTWAYGQDIYDIDISPDGRWLSGAVSNIDGTSRLVRVDLDRWAEDGIWEEQELADFEESAASNFVFSPDGEALYGTSYYSGVSNVFRVDTDTLEIDARTNAEAGVFRPLPLEDGRLLVYRYTGKGFVPALLEDQEPQRVSAISYLGNEIVNDFPVVRDWRVPAPSSVRDSLETVEGKYRPLQWRLNSWYPIVEGFKDAEAVGARFNFSDGLNLSGLDLSVSYSNDDNGQLPSDQRLHALARFHFWNWEVTATYNGADFYDLFGPTKTSRAGYSLGVSYDKVLVFDEPRKLTLNASLTGYVDLDALPQFQNISAGANDLVQADVSLDYAATRKSLGGVDEERGLRWAARLTTNLVDSNLSPRLSMDLHKGWELPIKHSSLWLRASAGQGFGDEGDPFGQFFFGGFGNNYIDYRTEKRYREQYAFPGIELNEVGGDNFGKLTVEWTLPPIRFRSAGSPGFYLNWIRPALFATGLETDLDDDALNRELLSIGVQFDLRMVFFSNLSTTLSVGYAEARESGLPSSDEFMISLKIL